MTATQAPAHSLRTRLGRKIFARSVVSVRISAPFSRKSTTKNKTIFTVAILATAICAVAPAAVASAAVLHDYQSQITEVPAGSSAVESGPFTHPSGMTVDGGDLYLANGESFRSKYSLDKFDASSGTFVSQFPQAPASLAYLDQELAVGHATGETGIYATGDEIVNGAEGAVAVFNASGDFQAAWKGTDTPSGSFGCFDCSGRAGIAVDGSNSLGDWAAGDVYVADTVHGVVDVFEPVAGGGEKYVTQITGPNPPTTLFAGTFAVAVNQSNGEVLIADGEGRNPGQSVDVFRPGALHGEYEFVTKLTGTPNGSFNGVSAIASDATTGNVFITSGNGEVDELSSSNVYLGRITGAQTPEGSFNLSSVAVDQKTHRVFVGNQLVNSATPRGVVDVFGPDLVIPDVTTGPATSVKPESATLNGTVNPDNEGVASCEFEWGTTSELGHTIACPTAVANGVSPVAVQVALGGLQPDSTYYFRLQATNKNGTNPGEAFQNQQFTTPGPGVDSESVSNITSSSASLNASVNPHNTPTTYYFQYGTSTSYGTSVPAPPGIGIGSGEGDVDVTQLLQGLSAATVYHNRVVAVSELAPGVIETFAGPDQTFITQTVSSGGSVLPDGRSWEMVSPPDKGGAQIYAIGQYSEDGAAIQASDAGNAVTYVTDTPTEGEPHGNSNLLQVFSTRGPEGWTSKDIAIPHEKATGISISLGEEYRLFSEDLSLGAVQPFGSFNPSVSAEASESTAYLRTDYLHGDSAEQCLSSCYRPLVTGAPGFANVPAGTVFGQEVNGECTGDEHFLCGPRFVGGTPDLSHVVLYSLVALTSTPLPQAGGLYEWSEGKLELVSVLPGQGQKPAAGPRFGTAGPIAPGTGANAHHAITDDGSRVFWEAEGGLYMRDIPKKETLLISHVGEEGNFEDASTDGSRVFYGGKMCEIKPSQAKGELECVVTDLGSNIVGASDDGSRVYFVAGDTLGLWHQGVTKMIASLSSTDGPDWLTSSPARQTARVSSDGHWLAFMSQKELTGASTRDAITGQPDEEVYLYDAEGNRGAGRLVCASCNPSGARPVGTLKIADASPLYDGNNIWPGGVTLASDIPGWTPMTGASARYQSRYLSDSGRLFFNSNDALVPQDVNGNWDVYQYEPPGVGTCSATSVTFSERSDGCVGLISSGESAEESAFLDASSTGGDVFFLTSAKLSEQDVDSALDVYDAHECSVDEPCLPGSSVTRPACDTGDSCKAAPSPQPAVFGSPASATFAGTGNVISKGAGVTVKRKSLTRAQKLARALRACKKKKKGRQRTTCIRQAKTRYAVKRSSKARTIKGSGR